MDYVAKPRGVKTGMAVWQAKQYCPDLVVLPPDMEEYIRFSKMAREIYEDYTDQIEPFGLDENWLDVTGSVGLYGSPMTIAREISERVKFEFVPDVLSQFNMSRFIWKSKKFAALSFKMYRLLLLHVIPIREIIRENFIAAQRESARPLFRYVEHCRGTS